MFRNIAIRQAVTLSKLTGVPIHPNPRPHLIELYQKTLKELESIPPAAFYRSATSAITQQRLNLVQSTEDVNIILKNTNTHQIEQLIIEAKDELKLLYEVKENKVWENLEESAPKGQWD